jgi:hypothetical protein
LSARLSLGRMPAVRVSTDVETPLVIGFVRPIVLLPAAGFARLSDRQQQMSICHELVHIKRADLRWGCIPAVAEWLFFFHPCARLAAREYALAREAACDAAVIEALDAAPQEYGRLLVDLGVAQPRAGLAAAGASWSSSTLKRRLVMLNQLSTVSSTSRLLAGVAVAIAAVSIVPVKLVARPAEPPPAPQVTTTTPPASQGTATATPATSTASATKTTATVKATAPQKTAAVQERKERPTYALVQVVNDTVVVVGSDVVLFRAPESRAPGATVSTASRPRVLLKSSRPNPDASQIVDHARTFRKENEAMIWFKRNDHEYVVRDASTIKELEAVIATRHVSVTRDSRNPPPVAERRAQRTGAPPPDVGAQLQELQARLAELAAQLKSAETGAAAERQMADVGRQLETLGRSMQQRRVVYANAPAVSWIASRGFNEAEVFAVLDRAIATGVAQQVK